MSEVVQAPALGYSITANLGDDKQIVVQCFADSEEELSSIHGKIDKAMAVVDRQKAKYRMVDTLKNIADMEKNLRRLKHDLVTSEKTFKQEQEKRDAAMLALVKERGQIQTDARDGGRAAPVGAGLARINAINADLNNIKLKSEEAKNSRDMAIDQSSVTILRFEEEIKKAYDIVAECETLIKGS